MKRYIFILLVLSFLLAPVASAVSWWPLVPCGLNQQPAGVQPGPDGKIHDYTKPCNKCELLHLLDNLIDFVFFGIAPILGTFFIVWAGARIITAGGFPEQLSAGKRMFWQTITAWIVLGLAWLGTNTLIRSLAGESNIARNWTQFTCTDVVPTPYVFPSITPPVAGQINACEACVAYRPGVTAGGRAPVCIGNYVDTNQPVNDPSRTCSFATATVATKLNALRNLHGDWVVTEGFPPTVNHSDAGHGNGTVVDIGLRPPMSATPTQQDVQRLAELCAAVQQAGFRILNEYTNIPTSLYQYLGTCPQPRGFQTTTGPHLHLSQ